MQALSLSLTRQSTPSATTYPDFYGSMTISRAILARPRPAQIEQLSQTRSYNDNFAIMTPRPAIASYCVFRHLLEEKKVPLQADRWELKRKKKSERALRHYDKSNAKAAPTPPIS